MVSLYDLLGVKKGWATPRLVLFRELIQKLPTSIHALFLWDFPPPSPRDQEIPWLYVMWVPKWGGHFKGTRETESISFPKRVPSCSSKQHRPGLKGNLKRC